MNRYLNRTHWVFLLGLAIGLTSLAHAGQPKAKGKDKDLENDSKLSALEEAEEEKVKLTGDKGTHQKLFMGTYVHLAEANDKVSPDVVGAFITNDLDKKPGRSYQVKAHSGNKEIIAALQRLNQKKMKITGKLRVIDENGEGKYLIVSEVMESAPTPPVAQRRKPGGL